MTRLTVPMLSLLAVTAACGTNDHRLTDQERSAAIVDASTKISNVSRYFVGHATTTEVSAAITADMMDSACVSVTTTGNVLQATFNGCASISGNFQLDGTLNATITANLLGGATVNLSTTGLVAADLGISGSWELDVATAISASATWTGDLTVAAFGGSIEATLTVDLTLVGLCLDLSLDATTSAEGSGSVDLGGGSASASGDASVAIAVNGLLSCGGCPTAGSVSLTVNGAADGGWTYGNSGATLAGSANASVSVSVDLGGLGFGCPVIQPSHQN